MTEPRLTTLTDFVPLEKLGTGSFSTVYKVRRLSDSKIYALKKVKLSNLKDREKQNAVNEIRILASINSPFIVGYKEALFEEKHNILCIVMEYADGGDLHKAIQKTLNQKAIIMQSEIWKAAIHILKGLQTLHSHNVLHRDLKSANIFLSASSYKLGDLNVSKVKKGQMAYTQTGTPYYASPEVWNDRPYDHKSDIWSFGCIVYQMCCLKPPFQGNDMKELNKSIQKCKYGRIPSCYSKNLEDLISMCLQKNPILRPSAQQLLRHKILKSYVQEFGGADDESAKKAKLLGTIRLPMNPKEFHQNLPKPKYEVENEEDTIQKPQTSKTVENLITPSKYRQRIRLSQLVSEGKPKSNFNSQRVKAYEQIINNSLSQQKQPRQIQHSMVVQSNETVELIKERPKERPVTSLPKTQRSSCQSNNQKPNQPPAQLNSQQKKIAQSDRVQAQPQKRVPVIPLREDPPKYYLVNKSLPDQTQLPPPSSMAKPKTTERQAVQNNRQLSPLLRRFQLNYQLNRVQEIKCRYEGSREKSPTICRIEAKLQKYCQPQKASFKRYSVMPAWWG